MTTETDKLVKMARAGGAESLHGAGKSVAMTPEQLAAFRDLIIASLCGDVEPVAWGLLPMNAALWVVYARNHLKWRTP